MYDPTQTLHSPTRFTVVLIALVVAVGPFVGTAVAQDGDRSTWEQTEKLAPGLGGQYGSAVAVDGDTAIVGAPQTSSGGYVQILTDTPDGWDVDAELVSPSTSDAKTYGTAVDVDGNLAIVGESGGEGAAHVYEKSNGAWRLQATLTPDNPQDASRFGTAVAVDDTTDTALVGARLEDTSNGQQAGAAYLFSGDSWSQADRLSPSSLESSANFGESVDLAPGLALVGAPRDDTTEGGSSGAAYVFTPSGSGTWTQADTLVPSDLEGNDKLGNDVDLDGTTALVGSRNGGAYVFNGLPGDGTPDAHLERSGLPFHPVNHDAVAIDGDTAVLGSQGSEAAFVFVRSEGTWELADELRAQDPQGRISEQFGASGFGGTVDVSGDEVFTGAKLEDNTNGRDAGAVYVFGPCAETGPLSEPIHNEIEPLTGPAQEDVHNANCHIVRQLES